MDAMAWGRPVGILFAAIAAAAMTLDYWMDPAIAQRIRDSTPGFRLISQIVMALALTFSLYQKRTVLIHRDATVEIVHDWWLYQFRHHYTKEEAFGLVVHELEIPDSETPTEIYEIELLLMDGTRMSIARFATLEELHDCRRAIEKFTEIEMARKKVLDPLR